MVVDESDQLHEESLAIAQSLARVPRATFTEMRRLTRGTVADAIRRERSKLTES